MNPTPTSSSAAEYRASASRNTQPARGNGAAPVEPAGYEIAPPDMPATAPQSIKPTPYVWRDPATIPTRQWLYGQHLIRRFLSCTVAAGGVGKSTLLLADSVAMVTSIPVAGHSTHKPLRVWYFNGEDPREEIERRLAAICLHRGIEADDLGGGLFVDSGRDTEIIIARTERAGFSICTPVVDAIIAAIRTNRIDVLIVDPFISSHRVSENDNGAIDAVAKTWARIADVTGCAIELVHHVRKTGGAEITAEDGRGASALISAARSVRVLNVMTEDEAARAGVDNRRAFFRVDNGKANLAPPLDKSEWFKLESVALGNGGGGTDDKIGVVTPWIWPNAMDGLSIADLRAVQDKIAGAEWAENSQATNWAGYAVADVLGVDASDKAGRARIKSLLATWIKNGVLRVERIRSARDGRDKPMIVVGALA